MGEEEKKEIIKTEERPTEEELVAEDLESTEESEDTAEHVGGAEGVGDPKNEDEVVPETEKEDIAPVAEKEKKEDPDKAKIAALKAGIKRSIEKGVRAGQDRYLARSLAYIEARRKALKTLSYIPKGFYKDKD